ncbi:MAG: hypothetical protein A2341_21540 [Deltaproteobacteria bacterium RIFOXYB12_FULL_58_9]|nr:MAG: hypothetical protein A2341_21540 [Deltaproteobacteria bacterium RIFOXYB12_FULL_58_9]
MSARGFGFSFLADCNVLIFVPSNSDLDLQKKRVVQVRASTHALLCCRSSPARGRMHRFKDTQISKLISNDAPCATRQRPGKARIR